MSDTHNESCKYFLTYSGVRLPLKLVTPLELDEIENRNTYFRAYFDHEDRMVRCQKIVYGEVEFEHQYEYYDDGMIKQADIVDSDDEAKVVCFSREGAVQG